MFVKNTMLSELLLDLLAIGKPKFGYYFEVMKKTIDLRLN